MRLREAPGGKLGGAAVRRCGGAAVSDANHTIGMICSRYRCNARSTTDTELGAMCAEHADPLLFEVQQPHSMEPMFLPWSLVRPHDRRARANHGGQTLARLSERGGLSVDEVCAVLGDREWRPMDRGAALAEIRRRLEQAAVKGTRT